MNIKRSLIALCVCSTLMGGVWETAVAKSVDKEQDSVKRWGRWAVLSPAAGQEEAGLTTIAAADDLGSCESSENCPGIQPVGEPVEPPPVEPPPVEPPPVEPPPIVPPPIEPPPVEPPPVEPPPVEPPPVEPPPPPPEVGLPVGFARIDYREAGSNQAFDRHVGSISLDDGTEASLIYMISGPSGPDGEIVNLNSGLLPVAVNSAGFRSTDRSSLSSISGRVTLDPDENVAIIEGPWRQISDDGGVAYSGEYVWGITATDAEISSVLGTLGSDAIAHYAGATATGGNVDLALNLSEGSWDGRVQGLNVTFDASGTVDHATFTATAFSEGVTGEMQGALVNAANNAIGSFEVEAGEGALREADVFNAALQTATPQ